MANIIRRVSLFVIPLLVVFSSHAFAAPVTNTVAENVGTTFLNVQDSIDRSAYERSRGEAQGYGGHSIISLRELKNAETGVLLAYVFALEPKGFVVVSPDTEITPIIAYSFEGNFNWEESIDNVLLGMLKYDMQQRVEGLSSLPDDLKDSNYDLWVKYFFEDADFLNDLMESAKYGPLLSTYWDQGNADKPTFNKYCPKDPVDGKTCIVGCVATAMAMIVNYHACTKSVTFTSADNYTSEITPKDSDGNDLPKRTIPITATSASIPSITYPNTGYNDMAAKISYACGVSVKMGYSSLGSGTQTEYVADALKNKFGFTSATYMKSGDSGFYTKLQDNIKNSKPAELTIDKTGASHAIVCDGYDTETGLYHLNYGWGEKGQEGTPDTWWYKVPSGMPAEYNSVRGGVLDIASSCKPSCPELHAWDGTGYKFTGSIFTRMHCPETERDQAQMVTFSPVPQVDGTLTFLIKEVDGEKSYINSSQMQYRYRWDTSGKWFPLPILSAMHNRTGDVVPVLGRKDSQRVFMEAGDNITLRYPLPPYGMEGAEFSLVSSGYYVWTEETWCKVLAKGPNVVVEPGATVNLGALINNMGDEPMPADAEVWFTLEDGLGTKVGPVSAAGLAPGSAQLYLLDWTVPGHVAAGPYAYRVSIFAGGSDITWDDSYYGEPHPPETSRAMLTQSCH